MDVLVSKLAKSNKRKRRWIYVGIVVGCFMAIAVLQFWAIGYPFWDRIIREAIWAIFSAVFVLAFVDFVKDEAEEEVRQREITKIVTNAMTLNDSFIREMNEASIDRLLKSSISHYADNVASSYVDYIKNHSSIYRSDFKYKVSLSLDGDKTEITHDVKYRKYFQVCKNEGEYKIKVYFATSNGGLDAVMGDDSIFFREELLYGPFVSEINGIIKNITDDNDKKKEVIRRLGLSFKIYDKNGKENDVIVDDIDMAVDTGGIMFTYIIKDEKCVGEEITSTNDIYMNYEARICFGYETKRENQFYCIFPNVTTGAQFEMRFDKNIISDIYKDVNYVTMLSIDDDNDCKITRNSKQGIIEFETSKTIFPRSGILVQWAKQ